MSKKLLTTLTAILLLFSTIAIAIQSASAETLPSIKLIETGTSTAEWVANPEPEVPGTLGDYSVKLYTAGIDSDYAAVEIIPPSGITIDDLDTITTGWSFWYYMKSVDVCYHGPLLELHFASTTGTGHVDITVDTAELGFFEDVWHEEEVTSSSHAIAYGNLDDGTPIEWPAGGTLATIGVDWLTEAVSSWELTRVQVQVGWFYGAGASTVYIDDITINTVNYPLEPIVLDAEWYKTGDPVAVEVVDAEANLRPQVPDTVEVTATSDVPDIITVTLTETGVATGIFEGTFTLVGEAPGPNDLLVVDGSIVTVTYEELPDTATVDDTEPTITIGQPAEDAVISDYEPLIRADLNDVGSGILSATMKLDGILVATAGEDATFIEYDVPAYPVELRLSEGPHLVEVIAYDKVSNSNTTMWSFKVDLAKPTVTIEIDPPPPCKAEDITVILEFSQLMDNITKPTVTLKPYGKSPVSLTVGAWAEDKLHINATGTIYSGWDGLANVTVSGAKDMAGNLMDPASIAFLIDTVKPTAPADLAYTTTDVSVTLTWTASTDVGGTGVESYEIYRDDSKIATVLYPTTTYTDYGPLEEKTYSYKVRAVDFAGNYADSDSVSVPFVPGVVIARPIELVEGWNLVSLQLIPEDPSIEVVLSAILADVDVVWSYDPITRPEDPWFMYDPVAPEISDLTKMEDGKGYWIKTTAATTLIVYGVEFLPPPATPPAYKVIPGWNLIGFKELEPMNASVYLEGVSYVRLWSFVDGRWKLVGPDDEMIPGFGYWIAVTEEGWIYP